MDATQGEMRHVTGEMTAADGLRLARRSWLPAREPVAALAVVHGYGEHSGRYAELAGVLAVAGYAVHAYDLRGHGRSGGRRGHVGRFSEYLDDTGLFLAAVRGDEPGRPVVLLGHSLGGLITASYVQQRPTGDLTGLALSSPFLRLTVPVSAFKVAAARVLSVVAPTVDVGNPLDAAALSHDQAVVDLYRTDPLNHHDATARWGAEVLAAQRAALAAAPSISLPLIVQYGGADAVADPAAGRELFARAASADKTVYCYPGYYHEIFNETGRAEVLADLASWLDAHTCEG